MCTGTVIKLLTGYWIHGCCAQANADSSAVSHILSQREMKCGHCGQYKYCQVFHDVPDGRISLAQTDDFYTNLAIVSWMGKSLLQGKPLEKQYFHISDFRLLRMFHTRILSRLHFTLQSALFILYVGITSRA